MCLMYICCLIGCFGLAGLLECCYLFSFDCLFSLGVCLLLVMFCGIFYDCGFRWLYIANSVVYMKCLICFVFDCVCI